MTKTILHTLKNQTVIVNKITDDYYIPTHKCYISCYDHSFLKYLKKQLKEMIKYKWSCEVIITGERRSGKSHLAQLIARTIDPNFPQENIVFQVGEFAERFAALPTGNPKNNIYPQIILDEAGYDLFAQRWYDRIQQEMVKLHEVSAAKYTIIYMIAPNLGLINAQFRNFGHFWIDLNTLDLERGIAEFWRIKRNKFETHPYYEPQAAFLFYPKEDDFWREYEKRKAEFILNATRKMSSPLSDVFRDHFYRLLKYNIEELKQTHAKISEILKCSRENVTIHYSKAKTMIDI